MRTLPVIYMLAAGLAAGQAPPPIASVSGTVKDAVSGQPLPDYIVSTDAPGNREVRATTDAQGRYRLSNLPPGPYRISARHPQHFGEQVTRRLALAGKDLEDVDFRITLPE